MGNDRKISGSLYVVDFRDQSPTYPPQPREGPTYQPWSVRCDGHGHGECTVWYGMHCMGCTVWNALHGPGHGHGQFDAMAMGMVRPQVRVSPTPNRRDERDSQRRRLPYFSLPLTLAGASGMKAHNPRPM